MTEYRTIPLANCDLVTKLDFADWLRFNRIKWRLGCSGSGHRNVTGMGSYRGTYLHRLILEAKPGQVIDHINRDPLDNRRENLRFCDANQNQHNRGPQLNKKWKGTYFDKAKNRWRAGLSAFGKKYYGLYRKTELEAAHDYDALAKEHHGKFAYYNFPQ